MAYFVQMCYDNSILIIPLTNFTYKYHPGIKDEQLDTVSVLVGVSNQLLQRMQVIQNAAARFII